MAVAFAAIACNVHGECLCVDSLFNVNNNHS
jgi:hypothetical protein